MKTVAMVCAALCWPVAAQDLDAVLKTVEARYNAARTLTLEFEQIHEAQGRRRTESGRLELRKPGRMRWDYAQPPGKLFVCDGKWLWLVSPATGRIEKARLRDSDDLRAPLAFLLGKLDFRRQFAELRLSEQEGRTLISALPRSPQASFLKVEFLVDAAGSIGELRIEGVEGSRQRFRFRQERLNAPVEETRFRYSPAAGLEVVEVETFEEAEP